MALYSQGRGCKTSNHSRQKAPSRHEASKMSCNRPITSISRPQASADRCPQAAVGLRHALTW